MTDRELLESAARAAGYAVQVFGPDGHAYGVWHPGSACTPTWDPFNNDGDALRLAVALGLTVHHYLETQEVGVRLPYCDDDIAGEFYNADPFAATRRAIVRGAAAMADTPAVGAA